MKLTSSLLPLSLLFLLFLLLPFLALCAEKQVYIVYFGEHKGDKALEEIEAHHYSYLSSVKESEEDAKSSLLYSYKHSINGFAAELTPDEAFKLENLNEVVSVFKSHPRKYEPHTTRSWEFVGLEEGDEDIIQTKIGFNDRFRIGRKFLKKAKYGDGIIVGLIDSGVWPEARSFDDKGMGPIPKSWKGICQTGTAFNTSHCNRKIIGARYYVKGFLSNYKSFNVLANKDFLSPRDADGHGSHTASTAVGRSVPGASAIGGFAMGTASGGATKARLAVYKACWAKPDSEKINGNICLEEDMLAAIDDAIADGVHVISISIGTSDPLPFSQDGIAIGALHAARRNIVVAASAGNSGPKPGTVTNLAPWMITVSASSLDRSFVGGLVLGNGLEMKTDSFTSYEMDRFAPLVYAADVIVPGVVGDNDSSQCLPYSLSPNLVEGKVVLCERGAGSRIGKSIEVKRAGGVGMILANSPVNGDEVPADSHFVPAIGVTHSFGRMILDYIKTDTKPMAFIKPGKTVYQSQPAPYVTGFSSRGPNAIDPNILKPDISAPGLYILAAWSGVDPPTKISADPRSVEFNLYSGTSMSCPHISGAIALIKAVHPTWSSAAIRSALMTTAWMTNDQKAPIQDSNGLPATPFAIGSGHFRPAKAADPGLVYDASYRDYLLYCCSIGLTGVDPKFKCPETVPLGYNLNYPSISISKLNRSVTVWRSVTNVGSRNNGSSIYTFSAKPPFGVLVKAKPNILEFNRVGEKKRFKITIKPRAEASGEVQNGEYRFGRYSWTDGHHVVRSPIAVSLT